MGAHLQLRCPAHRRQPRRARRLHPCCVPPCCCCGGCAAAAAQDLLKRKPFRIEAAASTRPAYLQARRPKTSGASFCRAQIARQQKCATGARPRQPLARTRARQSHTSSTAALHPRASLPLSRARKLRQARGVAASAPRSVHTYFVHGCWPALLRASSRRSAALAAAAAAARARVRGARAGKRRRGWRRSGRRRRGGADDGARRIAPSA